MLLERIEDTLGLSTFDYMDAVVRTVVLVKIAVVVVVEKTASVVVVCTMVMVEN